MFKTLSLLPVALKIMADFLSPEWWDQAGKDIARVFEGDKAVESDRVCERDKVSEEVVAVDGPQKITSDDVPGLPDGYEAFAIGGNEGDDHLIVRGNYNVFMEGGGGRDVLIGSGGNDFLLGQNDEDFLYAGAESDVLIGVAGADVFMMSKGIDQVWDFNLSQKDKISVEAINGIDAIEGPRKYTGQIEIIQNGFGTTLMSESGDQIFIKGATGSDVYNSIVHADPGQLVAVNFEVLA